MGITIAISIPEKQQTNPNKTICFVSAMREALFPSAVDRRNLERSPIAPGYFYLQNNRVFACGRSTI